MPSSKVSALTALTQGTQSPTDLLYYVDVSAGAAGSLKSTIDTFTSRLDLATTTANQLIARDYGGQVYNVQAAAYGASPSASAATNTTAFQTILNQFGKSGATSGRVYVPAGVYQINNTLIYEGDTTHSIHFEGAVGGTAGATGAVIKWAGAAGGTVLMTLGANGCTFRDFEIDCNSIAKYGLWVTASNAASGASQAIGSMARASNVVTVTIVGHGFTIGQTIIGKITGCSDSTFNVTAPMLVATANTLTFPQSGSNATPGTPGTLQNYNSAVSSTNRFQNITVQSPNGSGSAAIALGLDSSGSETSEVLFDNMRLNGQQILNASVNGVITLNGGNCKNFTFIRPNVNGFDNAFNFTTASGVTNLYGPIVGLSLVTDLLFGSAQLNVSGWASENSTAGVPWITSTGNAAAINLDACTWIGVAASDDVVITVGGALNMRGCSLLNQRTGSSVPKIKLSNPLFNAAGADSIFSVGNWFQNVTSLSYIPVIDGSANAVTPGTGTYANQAVNITSISDYGGTTGAQTHLSNYQATTSLISQQTAGNLVPASGLLRAAKGDTLMWRNNAASGDLNGVSKDTSDVFLLGDAAGIQVQPLDFLGISAPSLSAAGHAKLYATTGGLLQLSQNGGAYAGIPTGTGTNTQVAFWSGTTTLTGNAALTFTTGSGTLASTVFSAGVNGYGFSGSNGTAGGLFLSGTSAVIRAAASAGTIFLQDSAGNTYLTLTSTLATMTPPFIYSRNVSAQASSPVAVATTDSGKVFTNTGAAGSITFNLPATTGTGVFFTFVRDANQSVVIDAAGTDTITANGSTSSAGGTATLDAIGSVLTLVDCAAGKWYAISGQGSVTTA